MSEELPEGMGHEAHDLAELCEAHGLLNVRFEPITNGPHVALALEASLDLSEDEEFDLRVWIGMKDGRASTAQQPRTWISIDDEIYAYGSTANMLDLLSEYPDHLIDELWESITIAIRIMFDANRDLEHARAMAVEFVVGQLNDFATDTWDDDDDDDDGAMDGIEAMEAFVANCAIDLFRAVTVTEAMDAHLGFDISARTVDPVTEEENQLRVFWRTEPGTGEFVHCYGLGSAWCPAHDGDENLPELMATVPSEARHHYLHAFDHLHQIAHAAAEVANDNLAAAVEMIEDDDAGPLTEDDVHQLSHQVYASTLVELNPIAWSISGEPDLPSHEH